MKQEDLIILLWKLDWIKILEKAIKSRPSSWHPLGFEPIEFKIKGKKHKLKMYSPSEWKNASDEVCYAIITAIKERLKK